MASCALMLVKPVVVMAPEVHVTTEPPIFFSSNFLLPLKFTTFAYSAELLLTVQEVAPASVVTLVLSSSNFSSHSLAPLLETNEFT